MPNNISYYVDGNETTAKFLSLMINVFSREAAIMAHSKLLSSVKTLLKAALGLDVTSDIETAIMKGKNRVFKLDSSIATIEKNDWPRSRIGAYDVKFVLSRI